MRLLAWVVVRNAATYVTLPMATHGPGRTLVA